MRISTIARAWARAACLVALALTPASAAWGESVLGATLGKLWKRGLTVAEAQENIEVSVDADSPETNGVVLYGTCSGALIAPTLVLTAGHCVPPELDLRDSPHPDCALLPVQARLAKFPQSPPYEWRGFALGSPPVRVAIHRDQAKLQIGVTEVSLPRCADMALLRLAEPVPPEVARPFPVITKPPLSVDRTFGAANLRYAGWGIPPGLRVAHPYRQTGKVRYWGANPCFIAGIPPLRRSGQRIVSGDSGAPLLVRQGDREVVAGVLWGSGTADHQTCGFIRPQPPRLHGLYTPTFRPQVLGTGATDIGDWLRQMAPEAEHM